VIIFYLDSNVSDDSDITILSDEGCENDNEHQQVEEELVVCDADNLIRSGVFVELGAYAMSGMIHCIGLQQPRLVLNRSNWVLGPFHEAT